MYKCKNVCVCVYIYIYIYQGRYIITPTQDVKTPLSPHASTLPKSVTNPPKVSAKGCMDEASGGLTALEDRFWLICFVVDY